MKKKPSSLPTADTTATTKDVIPPHQMPAKKTNGKAKPIPTKDAGFSDELDNHELLKILSEVRQGNFSVRMPVDKIGLSGKICDTFNEIISLNEALVEELNQASNTIGKQGHLNHRVALPRYAKGSWAVQCRFHQ